MSLTSAAALQHVHRLAQAREQRPDQFRAADPLQQLVGDVAGFQVREDQHVRAALQRAERIRLAR